MHAGVMLNANSHCSKFTRGAQFQCSIGCPATMDIRSLAILIAPYALSCYSIPLLILRIWRR